MNQQQVINEQFGTMIDNLTNIVELFSKKLSEFDERLKKLEQKQAFAEASAKKMHSR